MVTAKTTVLISSKSSSARGYPSAFRSWRRQLSQEDWQQLIYVADSALITQKNLAWMQEQGLHCVSRLLDTFSPWRSTEAAGMEVGNWQEAGTLRPDKKAATYRWQAFTRTLEGQPYRFLVAHSDQLDKRKTLNLKKNFKKEQTALKKALAELENTPFIVGTMPKKPSSPSPASKRIRFSNGKREHHSHYK